MAEKFEHVRFPESGVSPAESAKEERVRQIESIIASMDGLIGSGEKADVYAGSAELGDQKLCVKHLARKGRGEVPESPLVQEMELQAKAREILLTARESEGMALVEVPYPVAYVRTGGNQEYFLMERVEGKTLYRTILENIASRVPESFFLQGMTAETLNDSNDADLEQIVLAFLKTAKGNRRDFYEKISRQMEDHPFLPPETVLRVRNSIRILNSAGFYHRDLHLENIMLSDDLKRAWLIDFGTASFGEFSSPQDATEVERMGEPVRYINDSSIVLTMTKGMEKEK